MTVLSFTCLTFFFFNKKQMFSKTLSILLEQKRAFQSVRGLLIRIHKSPLKIHSFIALSDYLNSERYTWCEIRIVWFAGVHSHVGTRSVKYSICKKKKNILNNVFFFNLKFIHTGYNIIRHTPKSRREYGRNIRL